MKHINLETFAGGAFTEQVNRAIEEVTKNIQDPNTDDTKVRKITITIGFKPNSQRSFAPVGIETKTTLAPKLGVVTAMSFGKDIETGEVDAVEIGNQIPGQMSFGITNQDTETVDGQAVDVNTGEIMGGAENNNNVINLRRQA